MVEMSCFREFLGILRLLRFDFTFFAFFLKRYHIWLRKKKGKRRRRRNNSWYPAGVDTISAILRGSTMII